MSHPGIVHAVGTSRSASRQEAVPVVVIDDDPSGLESTVRSLRLQEPHWTLLGCAYPKAALEAIAGLPQCVVVLDRNMPGMDGVEFARQLRSRERRGNGAFHILFLTGQSAIEDLESCLEHGDDFLAKPCDGRELRARILSGMRQLRRRRELIDDVANLTARAGTDPLTGLANRRSAEEFALREFDRWRRRGDSLCAIMADIDHFKEINDRHGHAAGDQALVETARILSVGLRRYDLIARWGGEEFLILCPHCTFEDALNLAERLRRAVENSTNPGADTPLRRLTLSFGVSAAATDCDSLDRIVNAADRALYLAKREGRNQVAGAVESPTPRTFLHAPTSSVVAHDLRP